MGNLVVIIVVLRPRSFTVRYKRVAKTIANLVLVAEKLESPPQARSKEKGHTHVICLLLTNYFQS